MESFEEAWSKIQRVLRPGTRIPNWTAYSGYLGDEMTILSIYDERIDVDAPEAKTVQSAPKDDFEAVWEVWQGYKKGDVKRKELTPLTRFTKYIISILHWVEKIESNNSE